jgi:catechol 2,3-dioxygenase
MTTIDTVVVPFHSIAPERIGMRPPGFRLPAETRVGTVTLQVADLDRSLAFYRDVIGFRELRRTEEAGRRAVFLGAQGEDRVLLALREKPGVQPVPKGGRLGIYHFAVLLPSRGDLGRFVRHAAQRGAHIGAADHLYSEATYLVDPDGITIEVYSDRPSSEWVITPEGEVITASEPFDYEGVIRDGGAEPYRGLPSGTRIGHMHFYVGDIAKAAAFYHHALGFDNMSWSFPGAVAAWKGRMLFVSAGGYHHHVGLNTWAVGSPVATEGDAKLVTWELVLPDQSSADAAAESLRRAGADVTLSSDGHRARDPWGITVRITTQQSV